MALEVKAAVVPHLGTWRSRRVTGIAASGDPTFSIDDIAEEAIEHFLQKHGLNIAYYSEDKGLVQVEAGKTPEGLLIIDPIDGTRAAIAGLESCVVSIAWADYVEAPTFQNVRYAGITEIKGDLTFTAGRGEGVQILDGKGNRIEPFLAPTTEISAMAWTLGAVGAPLEYLFNILKEITNTTTLRGGFFILNSSAYELTRMVTGQFSGVIDVRTRLLHDFPETRELFCQYGGGRPVSLFGYDIAAAGFIAQEAGCTVTDAWGRSLNNWNLLDTREANFGSVVAASNPTLHARIMETIEAGFALGI